MAEPAGADVRYTAFLSYSHRDAAAAARLHRRLEAYRIPRRLVGSDSPRGPVPQRLWPIFRDREELPAASDLSETVRTALAQSGALIILCSPEAAGSLWVAEEIETFRKLHPDRPILAAILDGDPPDCFPQALRAFGRDGTWHEPLATDLRRGRDGTHLGLLKLVAGITGIGLDDLVQRDASRRVRRVMAVTVAAVIAMLITTALALVAVDARRDAERERTEAERQRAAAEGLIDFMLTDLRERLRGVGNTDVMVVVNQRALAYYGGPHDLDELPAESLERRARILHAIGSDYKDRGDLRAALTAFREANRITTEQLERSPDDPERIYDHAQSEYWLGSVADQLGNYSSALAAYQRYREQAGRMNQRAPNRPRYIGELAYSESNLGSVNLNGFHRPQLARQHFLRSLHWFLRAAAIETSNRTWRSEVADAHAWLADTWFMEERYQEARAERLQEQRLKLQLLHEDPANRAYLYATVITARSLARIDKALGDYDRALALLDDARLTMSELLRVDPHNLLWRYQATSVETDRAALFIATGRRPDARAAATAALTLFDSVPRAATGAQAGAYRSLIRSLFTELRMRQPR
jgi:tetratricopeptide (TPR) repeat protein